MLQDETVITCDPRLMAGKPVIRGTRITVQLILERLASGWTPEVIVAEQPPLTLDDIQAAVDFAIEAVNTYRVYAIDRAAS